MAAKVAIPAILAGQIALSGISTTISSRWEEGPTLRGGGCAGAGDIPTQLNSNNQIQPEPAKQFTDAKIN